jgi:autotransporter-associated beta strand protein
MLSARSVSLYTLLAVIVLVGAAQPVAAQTIWTNGANNLQWGNGGNWSAGVPNASATALFGGQGTGTITLGTATTGALQFAAGGYTLGSGTLSIQGAGTNLSNSTGSNTISGVLSASALSGSITGGTLTLSNTSSATPNSLTGTITVGTGGSLTALIAGTVGTGNVAAPTQTSVGSNSLGNAAVVLNGGTLNLTGQLINGGLTGQFFDINTPSNINTLVNPDGFTQFVTGRSDFFVQNRYVAAGTSDRTRANALLNQLTPKALGGTDAPAPPSGTVAVNVGQRSALTPPADPNLANFYFGGLSFPNDGNGRPFGQAVATVPINASPAPTTTYVNIGQYQTSNHMARFSGLLNITTAGNYYFDTQSDDASLVYIDGKLVVDNNNDQGVAAFGRGRFGPIDFSTNPAAPLLMNLSSGPHVIEVLYQQGGGGAGLLVNYTGPDAGQGTGSTSQIPASALQGYQAQVNLGNNVTVSGNSVINATQAMEARIGTLSLASGSNLQTGTATSFGNALVRAVGGTTLASATGGTYTVNTLGSNDLALGTLTNAGGAATLVKTGSQNLILDGGNPVLNGGTIAYDVRNGRLAVVGDITAASTNNNPLGAGSTVTFGAAGDGSAILQLRTRNTGNFGTPNATFNNRLDVQQSGALEVTTYNAGGNTVTLGSTGNNAINVPTGISLTVDVMSATLTVPGTLTGPGTILKGGNPITDPAQLPANNSVKVPTTGGVTVPAAPPIFNGTGTMNINGDNSGFTGQFLVNLGTVNVPGTASLLGPGGVFIVNGAVTYQSLDSNNQNQQTGSPGSGTLQFNSGAAYASAGRGTISVRNGGTLNASSGTASYDGNIGIVNSANLGVSGTQFTISGGLNDGGTVSTINKINGGTLVLSGAAGSLVDGTRVNINAGTLNSNNATALGTLAIVSPLAGATFGVGANQTIGSLTGGGSVNLNSNALTIGSTNNLTGTFTGAISGAGGTIVKAGTGTQTFSNASSYGGGTTVNAGVLSADHAQALGTGAVTLNAGTLRLGNAFNPLSTPVTLSGYNQDLVRAVSDPSTPTFGTTTAVDGPSTTGGFAFYERGVAGAPNPNFGLPPAPSRTFTSLSNANVTYQLADYTQNNALQITANAGTGTLTLTTPARYQTLNILQHTGSSPGGNITYNVTLNFADSTTTTFSNLGTFDWFNGTPASTPSVQIALGSVNGLDRENRSNGAFDNNGTNPRIYESQLVLSPADQAKTLNSFTITKNFAGGTLNIFGMAGAINTGAAISYANNLIVGSGTSTANVTLAATAVNAGGLTYQTGTSTLTVGPDVLLSANTAYTLTLGPVNILGTGTLNVSNNGTATGTVAVGALSDGGAARTFTKAGAGTLTLTAPSSTITNGTQIALSAGTLNANAVNSVGPANVNQSAGTTFNIGASQAIGALNGTGTTNLNGNTLTIGANNNLNSTYGGVIADGTGSGSVIKQGTGTLLLNGVNTYTGPTTLSNGTLGGNGTIAGSVTVNAGTLSPGTSPGKLTTGAVTFTGQFGGIFLAELNGTGQGTTYDWLSSTGAVNLGSNVALLSTALGYAPAAADSLTIISGTSLTGTFANAPNGQPLLIGSFNGQMYAANVNYTATSVVLSGFQPVPEPVHILLLCGGSFAALGYWRRKRSAARAAA